MVAVLTVALGIYSCLAVSWVAKSTEDLYDHPFTVLTNLLQARTDLLFMEHHLEALPYAHNPAEVDDHLGELRVLDLSLSRRLDLVQRQYLGSQNDIEDVFSALARWRALRDEAVQHFQAGHKDQANNTIFERAAPARQKVTDGMRRVIDFASEKAVSFHDDSVLERDATITRLIACVTGIILLKFLINRSIATSIINQLYTLRKCMGALASGHLEAVVPFRDGNTELHDMGRALQVLKDAALRLESQRWVKAGVARVAGVAISSETTTDLAKRAMEQLVQLTGAGAGSCYLWNEEDQVLEQAVTWAGGDVTRSMPTIRPGEGLLGQCMVEKTPILVTSVPNQYLRISSGLGEAPPNLILVAPLCSGSRVMAVVELASFTSFTEDQRALIDEVLPILALNMEVFHRNQRTRVLLDRTRQQAEELAASEEELRAQSESLQAANQNLQEQTEELRASEEEMLASEEELRNQREELKAINETLQDRGKALEAARVDANRRALELVVTSRYKSEFLANMSHELRTPLNSLLILAKSLSENENGHLDDEETECAHIIHDSGTQLLRLINDILDLSKVEAGKMELVEGDIHVERQRTYVERRFKRLGEAKGLVMSAVVDAGVPSVVRGDVGKIEQVLNNLIGNAIKFTQSGSVSVRLSVAPVPENVVIRPGTGPEALCIQVEDTGIGIPADKIDRIFSAFEQIDGSSSRQFGGTGLGLTIARRLAQLMGGDITVESQFGKGSLFRLWLPLIALAPPSVQPSISGALFPPEETPLALSRSVVGDDRDSIMAGDHIILVIEDDDKFARIVRDLSRKRGFKCLVASDGPSGMELATRYRPSGIVMDIGLPKMNGWEVLEALKQSPATSHIPVHIMSAEERNLRGLDLGAAGYLTKPVDKADINAVFDTFLRCTDGQPRRLLLVDDDIHTRTAVCLLFKAKAVDVIEASCGEEALDRLAAEHFDCMILDLGLPGISGIQVLDWAVARKLELPPVVVYSARELTDDENLKLHEYTDSIVIKGARSPERLLDEVALFLHSVNSITPIPAPVADFAGRTVLVVDDDMRNVFALSKVLRAKGFNVVMAQDGAKALSHLEQSTAIEIVLMDIMMPSMDGYDTIRAIRAQKRLATLPIIALTAKAMLGDREKCLEAGANDYVSKPVDIDGLLIAMRALL